MPYYYYYFYCYYYISHSLPLSPLSHSSTHPYEKPIPHSSSSTLKTKPLPPASLHIHPPSLPASQTSHNFHPTLFCILLARFLSKPKTLLSPFSDLQIDLMNPGRHFDQLGGGHVHDNQLPPGFRFHPSDEELISYYLLKKVMDSNFTCRAIAEVDLNKCEPWQLPEKAKLGEKEWYFFSLRDRKYPTGLRTNRATEAGYWKATGKDREIYSSRTCSLLGMKKTLVFYRGRAPKGVKSNWVMHEYRLEGRFSYNYLPRNSQEEWVISRVFEKAKKSNGPDCKKTRMIEPSSPSSSVSQLPPLFDSSPYYPTASFSNDASLTDRDSCSHDNRTPREHVSCFSTGSDPANTGTFNHLMTSLDLAPPPQPQTTSLHLSGGFGGLSDFPSLRSLQENLQLPFFFQQGMQPHQPYSNTAGSFDLGDWSSLGNNWRAAAAEEPKALAPAEADCMWTY